MRIFIRGKRDLSSVVILNDLLERLARIPDCAISLMLADRTRAVETVVPSLIHMKAQERDAPFGVLFPLLDGENDDESVLDDISERYELPVASRELPPVTAGGPLLSPRRLSEQYGLSPLVVRNIEDPEVLAVAKFFAPDLIVSVRFSFKFREDFIALPGSGIVKILIGRLPDCAGLYPHFYSMLPGEQAIGCSVHCVDGGIDAGDILASDEVPGDASRSAFANNLESHWLGNRLLMAWSDR